METKLGKIKTATYGMGGYDGAQFGLSITLSMDGGSSGVGDFKGFWTRYPTGAQYSEDDWKDAHRDAALFVLDLLREAKVSDVSKLVGIPVEVTFDRMALQSWRVLTEVL